MVLQRVAGDFTRLSGGLRSVPEGSQGRFRGFWGVLGVSGGLRRSRMLFMGSHRRFRGCQGRLRSSHWRFRVSQVVPEGLRGIYGVPESFRRAT